MRLSMTELKQNLDAGMTVEAIAQKYGQKDITWLRTKIKMIKSLANTVVAAPVAESAQMVLDELNKPIPETAVVRTVTVGKYDLKYFIPEMPENYIKRSTDDDIEFWAGLDKNTKVVRKSISLIGESSSGKNTAVTHYAAKHKLPLLVVPCDDAMILRELLGKVDIVDGTTIYTEGLLSQFIQQPSVVLFDEYNCMPSGKSFMLHELLQNRTLFLKDAPADRAVVKVHPECRIFLAQNPPTAKYSGTNRLNAALASRPVFIELEPFAVTELNESTGNDSLDKQLVKFYSECQRIIKEQNLRISINKRNFDTVARAIRDGFPLKKALAQGFINCALATASATERDALVNLAVFVFGPDVK